MKKLFINLLVLSAITFNANAKENPLEPKSLAINSASAITTDATGQYVYVAVYGNKQGFDKINLYKKDSNKNLNYVSSVTSNDSIRHIDSMITSNDGKYIYAAERNNIDVYQVNSVDHSLSQISNIYFRGDANGLGIHMDMTSDDKYLYLTSPLTSTIIAFDVNSDGSLTKQSSFNTGSTSPSYISITNDNKYMYVSDPMGGEIHEFAIGNNGSLSPLSIPSINSEYSNVEGLTMASDGNTLYANACQSSSSLNACAIFAYTINKNDGTLVLLNSYPEKDVAQSEIGMMNLVTIIPNTNILYASTENDNNNGNSTILAYKINSDGSLVSTSNEFNSNNEYSKIVTTTDSSFVLNVYFLNSWNNNSVDYYSMNRIF